MLRAFILIYLLVFIGPYAYAEDPNQPTDPNIPTLEHVQFCLDCIPDIVKECKAGTLSLEHPCVPDTVSLYPDPNDPNSLGEMTQSQHIAIHAIFAIFSDLRMLCDRSEISDDTKQFIQEQAIVRVVFPAIIAVLETRR